LKKIKTNSKYRINADRNKSDERLYQKKNMDFNKMQGQAGMCANDLDFFIIQ
jgi:hypothetical protein